MIKGLHVRKHLVRMSDLTQTHLIIISGGVAALPMVGRGCENIVE